MSAPDSAVKIRPSTPADAEAITRIYIESAEHHQRIDPERYWVPANDFVQERYCTGQQHAQGAEATTLVAESGGMMLGFVDVRLNQSTDPMHKDLVYCHIVEIAVSEKSRSQGVGAQLMCAAEDWGRGHGAELASLEYNAANQRAADFYHQRMGYKAASIFSIKRL